MKTVSLAGLAFVASVVAAPAMATASGEPPMNNFDFAYYTCDNGAAFQMSYDSRNPTSATMTTSNNNTQHSLKRTPVDNGVQFSNGHVTFWTNGSSTVVKGTETQFTNCKIK